MENIFVTTTKEAKIYRISGNPSKVIFSREIHKFKYDWHNKELLHLGKINTLNIYAFNIATMVSHSLCPERCFFEYI